MTYYLKAKVSSCQIAGAVARVVLEDIRVNSSNIPAVPEIHIDEVDKTTFSVSLSVRTRSGTAVETFSLGRDDAFAAARQFQKTVDYEQSLMDSVQGAMSRLEKKYADAR